METDTQTDIHRNKSDKDFGLKTKRPRETKYTETENDRVLGRGTKQNSDQ